MTYSSGSRKDVRAKEKAEAALDRQRGEVISALMQSTVGRAYCWAELESCHIFHTSYSPDPQQMAFNEGERNVGLQRLALIMDHSPDEFLLMWREQQHGRSNPNEQPRGSQLDGGDTESVDDSADSDFTSGDIDP